MAKGNSTGGRGLNLTAKLNVAEAIKAAQALKKEMAGIAGVSGAGSAKAFDVKPLSEYQAGLLRIKEETLNFAKIKASDAAESKARLQEEKRLLAEKATADKKVAQERTAAEKTASLAVQAALRDEAKIRREAALEDKRLKQEALALQKQISADANKKKPTQISNSQAEIDAYKKAQQGSILYTAAINNEVVARAKANAAAANAAVSNGTLNAGVTYNTQATQQQTAATNANVLSKKQLAQMLAEEKYRQAQATAELKNNAREMLNAKGSLEQRRAALIRLNTVYDRLNKSERESASGNRMANVIKNVTEQVKQLEAATGRAQRNVGNYPNPFSKIGADANKLKDSAAGSGGIFSQLFSSIGSGAASVLAPLALIGATWTAVKAIFSHNIEISDSFADVRRTAKLSNDEVNNLADSLKELNTRTNLEGLLDIGFIGGRLGVSKSELPEFIKQVDELAVVLKKELPGGAEAVAESLGRIVTIYKVTQAEGVSLGTALSKVGSNLLELAHSGPVTVKYLQDFTLGVAGTAASAKLSIPVISAYGAVLGESGQIASSAALSVTRLVTGLTTKTGKYAAIAQLADSTLTVEKFTKIVNTDTQKALDLFFKGLKAGNPVATEFAARLGSVGITTGKVTNAVKILAENQDKLADRIEKGTHAFEEGTSVAHNFEIANDTLGASVDKLGNAVVNLTTNPNSNMANFFKGLIDGATKSVSALDILIATVKGLTTDPKKFIGDSAAKSRAETLERINAEAKRIAEAAYRNKDTNVDGERLTILKEEVKIRDVLNNQYLAAKIAYTNTPVKDRSLASTQQFQEIENKLYKQIALVRELNKLRNGGAKVDVVGTGELADADQVGRTIDDIKADIKRVTELKKPLDVASKQYKEYVRQLKGFKKELKEANGGNVSGASENQYAAALKARNTLQEQISALTKKGTDKQLSADDQELESVRDKYEKMRTEAIKFNNDKGNKAKGLRVDAGGLLTAQSNEEDAVKDKQATAQLKITLEDQKKLYDDYEEYKTKLGEDKAKDRYVNQINTDRTYLQTLQDQLDAITNPQKSKGGAEVDTAGNSLQIKLLKESIATETALQEKKYSELLEKNMSYEQRRSLMIKQYNSERAKLVSKGDLENAAILDKLHKEALGSIDDQNAMQLQSFKALFEGIDKLGDKAAKGVIVQASEALKALVSTGKISKELAKEINEKLFDTGESLKSRLPERLSKLSSELSNLGGQAGEVDKRLGEWLVTLGSVIGGVAEIRSGLNDISKLKPGDLLGAASSGVGLLSAFTGIAKSVQGLFEKSSARQEAQQTYSAEQTQKRSDAVSKQLERQLQLINDVYGNQRIEQYRESLKDINGELVTQQGNLKNLLRLTGDKANDENIAKLNAGGAGYIKGLSAAQIEALRLPINSVQELQKLLDNGLLDDATAKLVQNFINLKQAAIDAENAIKSVATGSSFSELADSIVDIFAKGNASAEDFGANFEAIIKKSLINSFKTKVLADQLQKFYDQFAVASESNGSLDKGEIDTLKTAYDSIIKNGIAKFDELKKLGIDFNDSADKATGASGKIVSEALTEGTANRGLGIWQAQYDIQKVTSQNIALLYQTTLKQFDATVQIAANTLRTANNTEGLAGKLDKVIENTTPTKGNSFDQALRDALVK